ncbi:MAG: phosphoethanolamine transferase [Bacteroidales bacterium]|jgi:glucan phosphoethanolaminetransferase (alkaline phosphatase superfamily)|nr:phosphoethanolamine transferase [Bacteroidales bacterium]
MFIKKNLLHFFLFVVAATLFIGIAFTSADFFTSPVYQWKDRLILFAQWFILIAALLPMVYLVALNRYSFVILYPLICSLSSILMYFRYATGTTLTTMMLDAALDNDIQISLELITPALGVVVGLSIVVAVLFSVWRFKKIQKPDRIYLHYIMAFIVFLFMVNIPKIKRPLSERIPFNLYYITARYMSEKEEIRTERSVLSENILCNEKDDLLVLLVLGESLRADHLGFNGYERNTTPYLSREDIISFPAVFSEYTHTNASLPHILTRADSLHPDRAMEERSFIDLFKRCNFHTVWLANQEPAKTYIYFMNECDTLIYATLNKSPYVFDKWTDEEVLPLLDFCMEKEKGSQLIVIHTIGSHWYYNSHYTDSFQKYNPVAKSRIVNTNTREEMINSYDNTVLSTDYFVYEVIHRLRNRNAILFFLSDHGEALGENGIWLHAMDAPPVHSPACWVWMSPQYKRDNLEKYNILHQNKQKRYRTDFLFPTILEAADIQSDVIDKRLSLFRP